MSPLAESPFCWNHDPANAEPAAEARRMGGLRRRREGTVASAYDFEGLTSVTSIRRVLEIATLDALGLDNSISRARTLIAAAQAAAKLLETGELEERIKTLEGALLGQKVTEVASPFDLADASTSDFTAGEETTS
jgi:hypothetical protein